MLILSSSEIAERGYDPKRQRYPYCVAWTPLPLITWMLPFIGHTGICTSDGSVHDFAGPYTIGIDYMAFGKPYKIWNCNNRDRLEHIEPNHWDKAIEDGDRVYRGCMHNLFFNNCHSHVARCLNEMRFEGKDNWNMFSVCWRITFDSAFVSGWAMFWTFIPFFVIVSIILTLALIF